MLHEMICHSVKILKYMIPAHSLLSWGLKATSSRDSETPQKAC